MADIAAIIAMTPATASNVQSAAAPGANASDGSAAPFGVLLQQMTLAANDDNQPAVPNNGSVAQTDPGAQDNLVALPNAQTTPLAAQDISKLIVLLQNATPQQSVKTDQTDKNTAVPPAATDKSKANDTTDASLAVALLLPQQSQLSSFHPQSGNAAAMGDPKSTAAMPQSVQPQTDRQQPGDAMAAIANAAAPSVAPNAQPTAPADPGKTPNAKPSKSDPNASQDVNPAATNASAIAPDADLAAALAQQAQVAAIQTQQPSPDTAVAALTSTAASPAQSVSDVKPAGARAAGQTPDKKAAADFAGALNAGASNASAPKFDTTTAGASGDAGVNVDAGGGGSSPSNLPAGAPDAAAAQTAPLSPYGQSPDAAASAAVSAVQGPAAAANSTPVDVNFQVAPQHHTGDAATATSTVDALGVTIAAKSVEGIKHFDIRLDPLELGRLDIHISVDDAGKTQASVVVDKPQTLELLQRDAANLTRSLNEAGVSLSNNGLNFSLKGQDRQNDGGSVAKGRSRSLSVKAVVNTDVISNSGSTVNYAPGGARLDIRV